MIESPSPIEHWGRTVLDCFLSNQPTEFSHLVYGLTVKSNRLIPDLPKASAEKNPEVVILMSQGCLPDECDPDAEEIIYTSPLKSRDDYPNVIVSKERLSGTFWLRYCDGIEFTIDKSGTKVCATWPETMTLEDTVTYLLGPVLGLVLRLKGFVSLHASSVVIGSKAIAFLGGQGAGKSTLAAAFAIRGYPVLSDDLLVITEQTADSFLVQPAYPRIRLWPESVPQLDMEAQELPFLTPNWGKRYMQLGHDAYKFQFEPLPLAGIYVLEGSKQVSNSNCIRPLNNAEGMMSLVSNSYVNYLLDRSMRGREFRILNRVVGSVPVRSACSLKPHMRPVQLCEAILEDFQKLAYSAPT